MRCRFPKRWRSLRVFDAVCTHCCLAEALQKNIVHRDIGARNVFIGDANTVKIGDFGMARVIPIGESSWKMKQPAKLPIRYLAPEVMEFKIFSQASDVWSFGVVQWEIMAYAQTPYDLDGVEVSQIWEFIGAGKRLKQPPVCGIVCVTCHQTCLQFAQSVDDVTKDAEDVWLAWYEIVLSCMAGEAGDRPTFAALNTSLSALLEERNAVLPAPRDIGLLVQPDADSRRESKDH